MVFGPKGKEVTNGWRELNKEVKSKGDKIVPVLS
jgi:hypothetical protein